MAMEIVRDDSAREQLAFAIRRIPTNFIFHRRTLFVPVTTCRAPYSTVTDLARFLGLSTSVPRAQAV